MYVSEISPGGAPNKRKKNLRMQEICELTKTLLIIYIDCINNPHNSGKAQSTFSVVRYYKTVSSSLKSTLVE